MGAKYLCPRHPTVHTRRRAHHEVLRGSGAPSWGVIGQGFIYLFSVRIFAPSHTLKSPGTGGRPTAVSEAEQIAVDGHSKGCQPNPAQPKPTLMLGTPACGLAKLRAPHNQWCQPQVPAPCPSLRATHHIHQLGLWPCHILTSILLVSWGLTVHPTVITPAETSNESIRDCWAITVGHPSANSRKEALAFPPQLCTD